MSFWDTAALAPHFLEEATSKQVRLWIAEDPEVAVWMFTRVELCAAIARRRREHPDLATAFSAAQSDVIASSATWVEVTQVVPVRERAEALLQRHLLRAADALQLGAAMIAAVGDQSLEFVTFDERLAEAARREGFPVFGCNRLTRWRCSRRSANRG